MSEQVVSMDPGEWQQLLAIVCNAQGPGINWAVVNPLVMKLGEQLRAQTPETGRALNFAQQTRPNGLDEPGDPQPMHRVPRPQ